MNVRPSSSSVDIAVCSVGIAHIIQLNLWTWKITEQKYYNLMVLFFFFIISKNDAVEKVSAFSIFSQNLFSIELATWLNTFYFVSWFCSGKPAQHNRWHICSCCHSLLLQLQCEAPQFRNLFFSSSNVNEQMCQLCAAIINNIHYKSFLFHFNSIQILFYIILELRLTFRGIQVTACSIVVSFIITDLFVDSIELQWK